MIIVDTNIASELLADEPSTQVIAWLDRTDPEQLWTTAITVFEIKGGIDRKPKGRRKRACSLRSTQLLIHDFQNRVLPFDRRRRWMRRGSTLIAGSRSSSRPGGHQIAGIAVSGRPQ